MEPKKSKYDTNPLDPDFVKNVDKADRSAAGRPQTEEVKGATREVGPATEDPRRNIYSEAPTRRYDNVSPDSPYPSVFVPPSYSPPPAPYQPPPAPYRPQEQKPTHRSIPGIGLPEKWAMVLPYAPFYVGVVVGLIELFLVPRKEPRVRFHAAQGLALHIAILVVQTLFGVVGTLSNSRLGGVLFSLAAFVFLIVSMIRVWKGEPHSIAPLAEPSQWLNEHINPRTKS